MVCVCVGGEGLWGQKLKIEIDFGRGVGEEGGRKNSQICENSSNPHPLPWLIINDRMTVP